MNAITTAVTIGGYAVAAGIGLCGLSDAGEALFGVNGIRDYVFGGNQAAYDNTRFGLNWAASMYGGLASMAPQQSSGNPAYDDFVAVYGKKNVQWDTSAGYTPDFKHYINPKFSGTGIINGQYVNGAGYYGPQPVYLANLSTNVEYKGKIVTQDNKLFDPNAVDDVGRTNTQRLQRKLSPIGYDGKKVIIHHIDQTDTGPVMEISTTAHQQGYSSLHTNTGQSPSLINRRAFDQWRGYYWQWRAKDFDGG